MGEGIGESEMEELVPERGRQGDKGSDKVKHNERTDQLFYRG